MSLSKLKKYAIRIAESIVVVTYIIFEELIWNILAKPVFLYFKSLIVLEELKATFLDMHRYLLLCIFLLILVITEGLGFLSGITIINGYFFWGVVIYALKIPVAALTFWLFDLTRDKLMTFFWLQKTYALIMSLIDQLVNSTIHVYIKSKIVIARKKIRALLDRYLKEEGLLSGIRKRYYFFKMKISGL